MKKTDMETVDMSDVTLLEKLFDADNDENIFLFDDSGKEIELEQVAAINHEGEVYAVLHPIGRPDEEVLVFKVDSTDEDSVTAVDDEKLAQEILKKAVSG